MKLVETLITSAQTNKQKEMSTSKPTENDLLERSIRSYIDESKPKPVAPVSRKPQLIAFAVITSLVFALGMVYYYYKNRPSTNASAVTAKISNSTTTPGPTVTLKNPFVTPTPTVPFFLPGSGFNISGQSLTCLNLSTGNNNSNCKYGVNVNVGTTVVHNWGCGYVGVPTGCSGSTGGTKTLDVSKTVLGLDPYVCTQQLANWLTWGDGAINGMQTLCNYNGGLTLRPTGVPTGWTTLGDFFSRNDSGYKQPVVWAAVPLFWTVQGVQSSQDLFACVNTFSNPSMDIALVSAVLRAKGGQPSLRNTVNWDSSDAASDLGGVSADIRSTISSLAPYQGPIRANAGMSTPGSVTYNSLTRLPRVGDIVASTTMVTINAKTTLSDVMKDAKMDERHLPYIQALNNNSATTKSMDTKLNVGDTVLLASLPSGYTDC